MSIKIYYDNVNYKLRESGKVIEIINKVIRSEKKLTGDLNFIFIEDKTIKAINKEFLEHNYFTDVIAFDYKSGRIINGEVYISIDTVRKNANNYKVSLKAEVLRVMIHGILHLCGYDDKTEKERSKMKGKEDSWLKIFSER